MSFVVFIASLVGHSHSLVARMRAPPEWPQLAPVVRGQLGAAHRARDALDLRWLLDALHEAMHPEGEQDQGDADHDRIDTEEGDDRQGSCPRSRHDQHPEDHGSDATQHHPELTVKLLAEPDCGQIWRTPVTIAQTAM